MKICFISPKVYPLFDKEIRGFFGGAEVQLQLIAKELVKYKNNKISFIVADYGQKNLEVFSGISFYRSFKNSDSAIKKIFKFIGRFKKIKADIYIQRTLTPFSGILAIFAKFSGSKFVYMVAHDSETDGTNRLYKNFLTKILVKLVFEKSTMVLVQNDYEYNKLKNNYKIKNLIILKKGIDFSVLKESGCKEIDCIWIGRCEEWKKPELFLNLAKKFKNHKFLMICPPATGKMSHFNQIKDKAEKIDNLKFLSKVNNQEVYKYLSISRVFCLTSEKEGDWPMTVLEASANRLPILSMFIDHGGILSNQASCGFYADKSFEKLSYGLEKLLLDDSFYEQNKKNIFEYVCKYHDIKKNSLELYSTLTRL